MSTSAGRIESDLEQLENGLTNTALGYWCRLKKMLERQPIAVDDDERNRGVRCELVRCGLIQLVKEGIVCPLLDQLRALRESWKRRTRKRRNIQAAQAAQLLLFETAEISEPSVSSQGVTSSPQQQRRSERQARKPRQRGLIRRIRKWEAERRDRVQAAAPPQTPPIERNTASSCGARDKVIPKPEPLSPQVSDFLQIRAIKTEVETLRRLDELVMLVGWQRAGELVDEGMKKGATHPVGWALGTARNQSRFATASQERKPRRQGVREAREQRRREMIAFMEEQQRKDDLRKAGAAR